MDEDANSRVHASRCERLHSVRHRAVRIEWDARPRSRPLDIEVLIRCSHGKPSVEVVEYADTIDADLVVLGYQGHSNSDPGEIGSVTDRVVANAGRPVIVA